MMPASLPPAASDTPSRTGLQTVRSLLPYLWPKGDTGAHVRVVTAVVLLILAKVATVYIPIVYSHAVDALSPKDHPLTVPLGLIVNELVTNALKYAFPDDQAGTIQVGFENLVQGEAVLYVRDDGIGMGPPRPGSSGTGLVRRLVQQLGGQLDREEVQQGTGFAITFPMVT